MSFLYLWSSMVPVGTLITERPERVVLLSVLEGVVASIVALAVVSRKLLGMRAAMAGKSPGGGRMNRRGFLSASGAAALVAGLYRESWAQPFEPPLEHRLPASDADYQRAKSYIEEVPIQRVPLGF